MEMFEGVCVCLWCGSPHNRAAGLNTDDAPIDGDVSVCWACGGALMFDSSTDNGLRIPTPEELTILVADEEVQNVVRAIAGMRPPFDGSTDGIQ
jgi:hypothetical protein